jgi:hypothetical protein
MEKIKSWKDSVSTNYKGDIFSSRKPDIPLPGGIATAAMLKFPLITLISRSEDFSNITINNVVISPIEAGIANPNIDAVMLEGPSKDLLQNLQLQQKFQGEKQFIQEEKQKNTTNLDNSRKTLREKEEIKEYLGTPEARDEILSHKASIIGKGSNLIDVPEEVGSKL